MEHHETDSSLHPGETVALLIAGLQTSSLLNCERINFCYFKPPLPQIMVPCMTGVRNEYFQPLELVLKVPAELAAGGTDFYGDGQWYSRLSSLLEFGIRLIWQVRHVIGETEERERGEFQGRGIHENS